MSRRGWFLFVSLGIIWGLPYLFIKVAVEHLEPPIIVFLRVVLGAALLLPIAIRRGALRPVRQVLGWTIVFALVEVTGPWVLLSFAETRVSSSFAALMISAVPLVGAVLAQVLKLDDRLHGTRILGLAMGVAGVAALVGLDVQTGGTIAVVALIVTAVGYALGPIIIATKLQAVPAIGVITTTFVFNAIVYAPIALLRWPTEAVPASAWWSVLFLGVVATAIAFLVFFELIAEVGPTRMTVITYINPAVAVVLGVLLLDEPFTLGIRIGFPLVLLGSFLATRKAPPMEDEPVPA
jgi:drug/metabolite transporter (DMT)-like permease